MCEVGGPAACRMARRMSKHTGEHRQVSQPRAWQHQRWQWPPKQQSCAASRKLMMQPFPANHAPPVATARRPISLKGFPYRGTTTHTRATPCPPAPPDSQRR